MGLLFCIWLTKTRVREMPRKKQTKKTLNTNSSGKPKLADLIPKSQSTGKIWTSHVIELTVSRLSLYICMWFRIAFVFKYLPFFWYDFISFGILAHYSLECCLSLLRFAGIHICAALLRSQRSISIRPRSELDWVTATTLFFYFSCILLWIGCCLLLF